MFGKILRMSRQQKALASLAVPATLLVSTLSFKESTSCVKVTADDKFSSKNETGNQEMKVGNNIEARRAKFRKFYETFVRRHQLDIVTALSDVDGTDFRVDNWDRESGGGGTSCVLQDGKVFEKAGVNISVVYGNLPSKAVKQMSLAHDSLVSDTDQDMEFFACGISLVVHPKSPFIPTMHLNYRYFELTNPETGKEFWWFGGGTDMTPTYLIEEDVINFHTSLKRACDLHDPQNTGVYEKYKKWCDDYFTIPHRKEKRGVGGLFFDDVTDLPTVESGDDEDTKKEKIQAFQESCLSSFLPTYLDLIKKRQDTEYGDQEKRWQQLRRGRYVEFNLIYDRGTKFGLFAPNPRYESILMSLPLIARFEYMHEPAPDTKEAKMLEVLRKPVDWIPSTSSKTKSNP